MYHACNLSNRSPSQKLSKPVPTNGLLASRSTLCQTTVRPVRLGSLPNAPTRPPLESQNRANRLQAPRLSLRVVTVKSIKYNDFVYARGICKKCLKKSRDTEESSNPTDNNCHLTRATIL